LVTPNTYLLPLYDSAKTTRVNSKLNFFLSFTPSAEL
jgi:hypothetical protein